MDKENRSGSGDQTGRNTVITKAARKKLVMARSGDMELPKVAGMAFGDGGVDSNGEVIAPVDTQESLSHELYRKAVDRHSFPEETTCRYECTLSDTELAGAVISEVGLYDADGDILCIRTFLGKGKDEDVEQTYVLDDIF